ncbi:OprO/OprP family phosphate-selective porin [Pseudoxanthomonas beigongshangi]
MRHFIPGCPSTASILLIVSLVVAGFAPGARASEDSIRPTGRIYYDFARFDNDDRGAPSHGRDGLRLAWLGVTGSLHGFGYRAEVDVAPTHWALRNAWISRGLGSPARGVLAVGQMGQHFAFDERVSFNHRPAVESSYLVQTLAAPHRVGIEWTGHHADSFWGVSGGRLGRFDAEEIKGRGFSARAGHAFRRGEADLLHLAAAVMRERHHHPGAGGAAPLRVALKPAGHFSRRPALVLADYRNGRDVQVDKHGLEAAGLHGAWSWQAEYARGRYDDGARRDRVAAHYLMAAWLLTGEVRPYDAGSGHFGQLQPRSSRGAWELVARYDRITADGGGDGRHSRLAADAWTIGVNWYARGNVRVMLDWIDSRRHDRANDRLLDHTGTLAGRVQWDF